MEPRRIRLIAVWLATCMGLELTGMGIVFPVYARKLAVSGAGVEVLGMSAIVFSIASLVSAPLLGNLADRYGRRKLVLFSIGMHVLIFLGYYFANSGQMFVVMRALAGALTVGVVPAVMGMLADIVPAEQRGRWIGYVSGGSSVGLIVGPMLGGWLFDRWGLAAPFFAAALLTAVAWIIAFALVPETRPNRLVQREKENIHPEPDKNFLRLPRWSDFQGLLPISFNGLIGLLVISFLAFFSWAFVDPVLPFYIYDDLGWSSARFGASLSGYAVMLVVGEAMLGRLSDKYGRKLVIFVGLLIHVAQYIGLMLSSSFAFITFGITLSGLGEALFSPALNAHLLDVSPEKYRSRVIGFRTAANSFGGLVGPALVVFLSPLISTPTIFMISSITTVLAALLILPAIKEPLLVGFRKIIEPGLVDIN